MLKKQTVALAIFIAIFLASCNSEAPKIEVEYETFQFGDVVNGVVATKDMMIENNGSSPLIIDQVSTSCGCTTATVDPLTIPPGGIASLHIEFDSGAHGPEMTGEIMRQVFILSNDPDSPEVMVEFTANVVK